MRSDLPLTTRPPEHHPFFNTINTQTHRYHDGLSGERNKNKNVGFLSFSSSVSLLFFFFFSFFFLSSLFLPCLFERSTSPGVFLYLGTLSGPSNKQFLVHPFQTNPETTRIPYITKASSSTNSLAFGAFFFILFFFSCEQKPYTISCCLQGNGPSRHLSMLRL